MEDQPIILDLNESVELSIANSYTIKITSKVFDVSILLQFAIQALEDLTQDNKKKGASYT